MGAADKEQSLQLQSKLSALKHYELEDLLARRSIGKEPAERAIAMYMPYIASTSACRGTDLV